MMTTCARTMSAAHMGWGSGMAARSCAAHPGVSVPMVTAMRETTTGEYECMELVNECEDEDG